MFVELRHLLNVASCLEIVSALGLLRKLARKLHIDRASITAQVHRVLWRVLAALIIHKQAVFGLYLFLLVRLMFVLVGHSAACEQVSAAGNPDFAELLTSTVVKMIGFLDLHALGEQFFNAA